MAGCEQKVPKEELGTVVFEVPAVQGADKPYEMPQLGDKKTADAPGASRDRD